MAGTGMGWAGQRAAANAQGTALGAQRTPPSAHGLLNGWQCLLKCCQCLHRFMKGGLQRLLQGWQSLLKCWPVRAVQLAGLHGGVLHRLQGRAGQRTGLPLQPAEALASRAEGLEEVAEVLAGACGAAG